MNMNIHMCRAAVLHTCGCSLLKVTSRILEGSPGLGAGSLRKQHHLFMHVLVY